MQHQSRTKTFTGCWTCRSRRLKCDEKKPSCRQCTRRGLDYRGYSTPQVHKSYTEEPKPSGLILERAADAPRSLKAIYTGAGISEIIAAIKFRDAVPDLDLTIYEKNPEIGGTWYENRGFVRARTHAPG